MEPEPVPRTFYVLSSLFLGGALITSLIVAAVGS